MRLVVEEDVSLTYDVDETAGGGTGYDQCTLEYTGFPEGIAT